MREAERIAFKSATRLKNVGRCPTCGAMVAMPSAACNHPKRKALELVALVERIKRRAARDGIEL